MPSQYTTVDAIWARYLQQFPDAEPLVLLERENYTPREQVAFRVRFETSDGCWIWRGSVNQLGYGLFYYRGRQHGAHRIAWELATGQSIPDGYEVDHTCRVRDCVRPAHLEAVSKPENIARRLEVVHCHPLEDGDIYVSPQGRRHCRRCINRNVKAFYAREKNNRARRSTVA